MGMFPSLPQLPEGYLFGLIPSQFVDPTQLFRGATAIDNKPANEETISSSSEEPIAAEPVAVTNEGEIPPADPVVEVPTEGEAPPAEIPTENNTTHHHPPPPPPPPAEEPKPKRSTLF